MKTVISNSDLSPFKLASIFILSNVILIGVNIIHNGSNGYPLDKNLYLFLFIANISVVYLYFTHIKSIIFTETNIIFKFKYYQISFNISDLRIIEKRKIHKLSKYNRLIFRGKNFWPVVKIDSSEWHESYTKLKETLLFNNLIINSKNVTEAH